MVRSGWLTVFAYALVALFIVVAWSFHERRIIVASEGLGYALGIVGASMMVLLLLYPLRKRAKFLRNAGPMRHWFRIHMILGIVGPVLVLFHSNFNLGSINSKVALFCTLVVSSSGILGRYLYTKIHHGLYGQRATFDSVRTDIESNRESSSSLASILPLMNEILVPIEDRVNEAPNTLGASVALAVSLTMTLFWVRVRMRTRVRRHVKKLIRSKPVIRKHQKRLVASTFRYLDFRLTVLRKFAQLRACERLFALWHVVHYPLFMVLVVAAIVHIVAVHMY